MATMDAWKTYVHVVVIHSTTRGQAQHNIHCHAVKEWSRETTTTRHEPLRALRHISRRACIVAHVVASFSTTTTFAQVCRISPDVAIYTYLAIPPDYLFRMLNIQPKPWLLSVTGLADFDLVDGV